MAEWLCSGLPDHRYRFSIPVARSIDNRRSCSRRKRLALQLQAVTSAQHIRHDVQFYCFERPEEIPTPTRSFGRATLLGRVHWPRRLTKTTRCSNEFHWHVAACGSAAAAYLQGSRASIVRDYSVITRAEPRQGLSWRKLTEVSMLRFRNEVRNCHDRSRGRAS